MSNKKEEKKGRGRKSYLKNLSKQGAMPRALYLKYKDFDPSDVHDSPTITYATPRGDVTMTRSSKTPQSWASELVNREGKSVGNAFIHNGNLYKIVPGPRAGSVSAEEVRT